jgi:hypothetical protein
VLVEALLLLLASFVKFAVMSSSFGSFNTGT